MKTRKKTNQFASLGLLAILLLMAGQSSAMNEDFYWKNSYGRGAGTAPSQTCGSKQYDAGLCYDPCKSGYNAVGPVCHNARYDRGAGGVPPTSCGGKEQDAGLCYDHCKGGYHGVGPVCWENKQWFPRSYGRGAGTRPSPNCAGGQQLDGGLCYAQCRDGYQGSATTCYYGAAGPSSYARGAGTAPSPACGDKQYDAGLCYEHCRSGYNGAGPVCWGAPPQGYVECGAGFATSSVTCAAITSSQSISVAMLAGQVFPAVAAANQARKAKMAASEIQAAENVAREMSPFMQRIAQAMKNGEVKMAEYGAFLEREWKQFLTPARQKKLEELLTQAKIAKGAAGFTYQMTRSTDGAIDMMRDIATLLSIVDPTAVTSVISAYSYPTYRP